MHWNKFAQEVHQNAVDHGWWDKPVDFATIAVMCHSELSEAVEEYRAGRPMVWHRCLMGAGPCQFSGALCDHWEGGCMEESLDREPRGVAVELADCILRILDCAVAQGFDIGSAIMNFLPPAEIGYPLAPCDFPEFAAVCHSYITMAYIIQRETKNGAQSVTLNNLVLCIETILEWAAKAGVDMEAVLRTKHEYNKTRPYRHGGKKL